MADLIKRVLSIAASQVGVREVGVNRGTAVEAYLRAVGLGPGQPWCAAFVAWCFGRACADLKVPMVWPKSGSCEAVRRWARHRGLLRLEPSVGDVFLRIDGARARHTGFVEKVQAGRVVTIEGNTNLDGSREGIGVFTRVRVLSGRLVYVRSL